MSIGSPRRSLVGLTTCGTLGVHLARRRGAVYQCAEWAGHSVAVLHQIYAKVIAGLEAAAHQRIEAALGWQGETWEEIGKSQPDSAGPSRTEPGTA